eukprot:TRINITY_DN1551_c0_g2_i1.p1 TRINITY_DN1551_c0_g2~~TRINITY_DN1551_c0_g2_i1.p1  ORF type:complete len:537 (-),score=105.19 TRINITY_DN1551_c0_g2_i1:268-1752(-)
MKVAVKELLAQSKNSQEDLEAAQQFRSEVEVQGAIEHPNIVRILAICSKPFCIVQELCSGGNLYDLLHDYKTPITLAMRLKIALDIANGILCLQNHSPPIAHIDMKTPNILLTSTDPVTCRAKITDFGTSEFVKGPITKKKVDNPVWCAPETLVPNPSYDARADIYSYGVICWELLTRKDYFGWIPWIGDLQETIVGGHRPVIPKECPVGFKRIISSCWEHDPNQRHSMTEVVTILNKVLIPKARLYEENFLQADKELQREAELSEKREPEESKIVKEQNQFVEDFTACAWRGDVNEFREMLTQNVLLVNHANARGQTALYCAARQGHTKIVQLLLNTCQQQINPNVQVPEHGGTPLHGAGYNQHSDIVAMLLKFGADFNIKNNIGLTAHQEARGTAQAVYNSFQMGTLETDYPVASLVPGTELPTPETSSAATTVDEAENLEETPKKPTREEKRGFRRTLFISSSAGDVPEEKVKLKKERSAKKGKSNENEKK